MVSFVDLLRHVVADCGCVKCSVSVTLQPLLDDLMTASAYWGEKVDQYIIYICAIDLCVLSTFRYFIGITEHFHFVFHIVLHLSAFANTFSYIYFVSLLN